MGIEIGQIKTWFWISRIKIGKNHYKIRYTVYHKLVSVKQRPNFGYCGIWIGQNDRSRYRIKMESAMLTNIAIASHWVAPFKSQMQLSEAKEGLDRWERPIFKLQLLNRKKKNIFASNNNKKERERGLEHLMSSNPSTKNQWLKNSLEKNYLKVNLSQVEIQVKFLKH